MGRTTMSICAGATTLLLACLPASPAAAEELLQVYQSLAKRHLRPAPLVPISAPPSIAPIERTVQSSTTRVRNALNLRVAASVEGASCDSGPLSFGLRPG